MTPEQFEVLVRLDQKVDHVVKKVDDHEDRIRANETHRNWVLGFSAAVSGFIAWLFSK